MKTLVLFAALAVAALAQEKPEPEKLVTVPAKYVSSEGLAHQASGLPATVSSIAGIGKEIGIATREGLSAVVDEANRFGTSKVGTFVMWMIAWKIIGHEVLRFALGIPIFFFGVWLWSWSLRKFFFGSRSLVKQDGKVKEWATLRAYQFDSGDARVTCGIAHFGLITAWAIAGLVLIFG